MGQVMGVAMGSLEALRSLFPGAAVQLCSSFPSSSLLPSPLLFPCSTPRLASPPLPAAILARADAPAPASTC
jgi:hypothetical protein